MTAGADLPPVAQADLDAVSRQLGREARGVAEVAHRCPCGEPDVVRTEPRLPDGTPFPTSFYATCPRLTGALSHPGEPGRHARDERAAGGGCRRCASGTPPRTCDYLERRTQLGDVPEIAGVSAGGMPTRVKCLHVLVAHSLGAGPGVNPLGDEALAMLDPWWERHPCSADAPERRRCRPRRDRCRERAVSDGIRPRVAAIDCGTNSLRLLVADVGEDGRLADVVRRMEIVRLGQGIDRTGVIAPEAMARTLAVTREYAEQCRALGVDRVRFVATSASRDARNAGEFVDGVREAFGDLDVAPEVVAGDTEARFSFSGATGDLQAVGVPGPYLVVDLGGGSTELVRGTDGRRVGAVGRRRQRADDRAAPALRPTDGRRGGGGAARRAWPRSTRSSRPSTSPASGRVVGPGRHHHHDHGARAAAAGLRPGCRAPGAHPGRGDARGVPSRC